jgi:hypothetical protein
MKGATNDLPDRLVEPKTKLTSRQLHQAFHDTACPPTREPLPERWLDLLRYIDEKEVAQTKPQNRAR